MIKIKSAKTLEELVYHHNNHKIVTYALVLFCAILSVFVIVLLSAQFGQNQATGLATRAAGRSVWSIASAPTPIPTPGGAFSILPTVKVSLTCVVNDASCSYQGSIIAANRTGKALYNTTMYQSSYKNILSFVGFDSKWTTRQSKTGTVYQPGYGPTTVFKVANPKVPGVFSASFYVDAQTCNLNTNPPNCIYYGAAKVVATVNVVKSLPPTSAQPSP
ncbi:hypothetical protein HY214_04145 [Candidatus Roizmanbacteria bacterium]|nr:hypothetical protein [Candidatus Roizmanbacteria bacterium]